MAGRPKRGRGRGGAATRFVLDCSVVLAWFFADEAEPYADAVAERLAGAEAIVPALWPLEVANAVLTGERRKRSTEAQASRFFRQLGSLPIVVEAGTGSAAWTATIGLARTYHLSAYDAAYLELAVRHGVPLATIDERLERAAGAVGIPRLLP